MKLGVGRGRRWDLCFLFLLGTYDIDVMISFDPEDDIIEERREMEVEPRLRGWERGSSRDASRNQFSEAG